MKTTKLAILSFMLISVSLFAQEFDQEFLDSLPDDVREDLETRSETRAQEGNETYRPYLYSSKLSQAEELLSLKDRLEKDLLDLERRLDTDENLTISEELKLYGSDFFNTFQTSFMPVNEPNPDSGYMLDVGDILQIQLVGQDEYIEDFLINSDGSINLPDIGKIIVAGLSLNDSSKLIKSKVNSAFIGTEAFISLSEIRDVNILVTGNAQNPGIYTLTGNSNILHAISAAGGISEFGSLREINLLRDKGIDFIIEGDILTVRKGNYRIYKDTTFPSSKRIPEPGT